MKKKVIKILSTLIAGGAYTVLPIDLIPDIVPLIGQSDDIIVLLIIVLYIIYTVRKNKNKEKINNQK